MNYELNLCNSIKKVKINKMKLLFWLINETDFFFVILDSVPLLHFQFILIHIYLS